MLGNDSYNNEYHCHYYYNSNVSATNGGCVWVPSWQAYCCQGLQHHMMVIESMDADTETRRLSPLALVGGDTGVVNYTDLMNGPMDHGMLTCPSVYVIVSSAHVIMYHVTLYRRMVHILYMFEEIVYILLTCCRG